MLTLDLIQEEDAPSPQEADGFVVNRSLSHISPDCRRSKTDGALSARSRDASGKSQSLPREAVVLWEQAGPAQTPQTGKYVTTVEKNRCASMDQILTQSETKAAKSKGAEMSGSPGAPHPTAPVAQLQQLINQKLEKTEQLLAEVRRKAEGEDGEQEGTKVKEATAETQAEAERLLKEAVLAWKQAREVLEEVKELRGLYRQLDSPLTPPNSSKTNPVSKSPM